MPDNQAVLSGDKRGAVEARIHFHNRILRLSEIEIESDDAFFIGKHKRHGKAKSVPRRVNIRLGYKNFAGIFHRAFVPNSFRCVVIIGHIREIGNYRQLVIGNVDIKTFAVR